VIIEGVATKLEPGERDRALALIVARANPLDARY